MKDTDRQDDALLMRLRHGSAAERARLAAMAAEAGDLRKDLAEWDRQDAALLALYDPVAREPAPERLLATLRQAERDEPAARPVAPLWRRLAAALALIALGGAAGGGLGYHLAARPDPGAALVGAAFRAYSTYTVERVHPVEVAGSDQPHLSTWLSNRLGQRIAPPDLSHRGFSLMGGRVLPDPKGPAVLLMYDDDQGQRLTLYVAPEPGRGESAFRFAQRDATRSYWWFDDDLGCALVGDLPREALHDIAVDAYEQITDV